MQHLMIDIETLSTKPNGVILSIGAVFFDETGLGKEFYQNVDLESSIKAGFEIDAGTVYFWLKQSSEAGAMLDKDKLHYADTVYNLMAFIRDNCDIDNVNVWGNSPSFDLVMLKNYIAKADVYVHGKTYLWKFYNERDFRTAVDIYKCKRVKPTVAHNALEDAKAQAQTLINHWSAQNALQ
ncbi:hypothetical protein [Acinetobacter phage HFM1]|nr:hypothetical protein [Acinetobacter phage HFM1]